MLSNLANLKGELQTSVLRKKKKQETQSPLFSPTACSMCKSLSSFLCPCLNPAFAVQLLRDMLSVFIYPFPINYSIGADKHGSSRISASFTPTFPWLSTLRMQKLEKETSAGFLSGDNGEETQVQL